MSLEDKFEALRQLHVELIDTACGDPDCCGTAYSSTCAECQWNWPCKTAQILDPY